MFKKRTSLSILLLVTLLLGCFSLASQAESGYNPTVVNRGVVPQHVIQNTFNYADPNYATYAGTSANVTGYTQLNAFDNNTATFYRATSTTEYTFQIIFNTQRNINAIRMQWKSNGTGNYHTYWVDYLSSGTWKQIPGAYYGVEDVNSTSLVNRVFTFPNINADGVRVYFKDYNGRKNSVNICELGVYNETDLGTEEKKVYNYFQTSEWLDMIYTNTSWKNAHTDFLTNMAYSSSATQGANANMSVVPFGHWVADPASVNFNPAKWSKPVDEKKTFFAQLYHSDTNAKRVWNAKIGTGGQIYSLETNAGEVMPPNSPGAEMNDEVIQAVGSINSVINQYQSYTYDYLIKSNGYPMLHQSGVYRKHDPISRDTFYSPAFTDKYDATEKSYSTMAWGQMAIIPNIHTSEILYYTKYKDMGNGVIEVTTTATNYGPNTYDDWTVPWGGFRASVMKNMFNSNSNGTIRHYGYHNWGDFVTGDNIASIQNTGGWAGGTTNSADSNAQAVAWVFGKDSQANPAHGVNIQSGDIWSDTQYLAGGRGGTANAVTDDYMVQTMQQRVRLRPGQTFFWKSFLVVDSLVNIPSQCNALVNHVTYGYLDINATNTATVSYGIQYNSSTNQNVLYPTTTPANIRLKLFARPVPNSKPVYLLRDSYTRQYFVTGDPYLLCTTLLHPRQDLAGFTGKYVRKPYDGSTDYLTILGFAPTNTTNIGSYTASTFASIVTDRNYFKNTVAMDTCLLALNP